MARRSEDGFTLVEALASLAVLALLSLMLMAGTQFAHLQLTRMAAVDQAQAVDAAQMLLRARLQRAFPYAPLVTGLPTVAFDGTSDRLQFVGAAPDASGPDALQHYGLALTPGGVLQLSHVSDLALDPARSAQAMPLISGAASLDLAYFGAAPPDNQLRWRAFWRQQDALPQLVRVRVAFPPGDHRVWPDLLVAPAATLDSLCQIEVNTGRCRGRS